MGSCMHAAKTILYSMYILYSLYSTLLYSTPLLDSTLLYPGKFWAGQLLRYEYSRVSRVEYIVAVYRSGCQLITTTTPIKNNSSRVE